MNRSHDPSTGSSCSSTDKRTTCAYRESATTVSFSLLQEDSKETTEERQAELGDDEGEITEQDVDGERETGEENTSHLDDGDDDRADELAKRYTLVREGA